MRYAFFYEIPSTWTSDDYPRPADLADGEDHTMRFSFFMEHGGRSWDTQFNDYHGEYTMVVEDPEPAAGDEDDDDADDDEEDEDDAGEVVDAADDAEDAEEVVEETVTTADVEEASDEVVN